MGRLSLASLVFGVCAACELAVSQTTPGELIQYIREARKAGLKETQIRENAAKAGWGAESIKDALAAAASGAQAGPPALSDGTAGTAPATGDAKGVPAAPTLPPPSAGNPAAAPQSASGTVPVTASEGAKDRGAPDDYEIGSGDVLHISVWKEPDVSVQAAVVRPDGKISMPLLKEIGVMGLTVIQAEQMITRELSKFVTAPDVTVVIAGINSKKIYVTGAVKKEGPIPYTYRMTVLQALSEAGGLTDYAKRKRIYVLHNEKGRQFTFHFDYDAVLKGQRMELNVYLTPGDTVVVPH